MIRIRYRDPSQLSPGLHAAAERHGRRTTVYLLSGLTVPQRRAALRRLRLSARMGHCPWLPGWQLGLALLADRIRTLLRQTAAVFRCHPAGITVPVMMVSGGAIALLVLSAVSVRVLHDPRAPGSPPARAALVPRQVAADTDRVAPPRAGATPSPGATSSPGTPGATESPGATSTPGATPSPASPSPVPPASTVPWPSLPSPPAFGVCVGVGQQGICLGG